MLTNDRDFALACLDYEKHFNIMKELEAEIADYVLREKQSTQTIGNVKAVYRKPRRTYHYQKAWDRETNGAFTVNGIEIADYTTRTTKIDYKGACEAAGITDIEWVEADPGVSVKVMS